MDLSKAFDIINHEYLVAKINHKELKSINLLTYGKNYYMV